MKVVVVVCLVVLLMVKGQPFPQTGYVHQKVPQNQPQVAVPNYATYPPGYTAGYTQGLTQGYTGYPGYAQQPYQHPVVQQPQQGSTQECICTAEYSPVCGANGETFANQCAANCAHVEAVYAGDCQVAPVAGKTAQQDPGIAQFAIPAQPRKTSRSTNRATGSSDVCSRYHTVCGSDGITYYNECYTITAGAQVLHEGKCAAQTAPVGTPGTLPYQPNPTPVNPGPTPTPGPVPSPVPTPIPTPAPIPVDPNAPILIPPEGTAQGSPLKTPTRYPMAQIQSWQQYARNQIGRLGSR
jgi:hypothetical protein